jgi:hypothetical protein
MSRAETPEEKVDELYRSLPESYGPIARALRATVRSSAPRLRETIKWNNPFWIGTRDVLCLQCYDDHVNLGVMRGAELAGKFPRIEGTGKAMRHVKITSPVEARSAAIVKIIRAAEALDRGGR